MKYDDSKIQEALAACRKSVNALADDDGYAVLATVLTENLTRFAIPDARPGHADPRIHLLLVERGIRRALQEAAAIRKEPRS